MKIKTFYAKTMAEAFREIRSSLGPEALLLSTKEIPRRSGVWGHSTGFEVVAAVDHYVDHYEDADDASSYVASPATQAESSRREVSDQQSREPDPETYTPRTLLRKAHPSIRVKGTPAKPEDNGNIAPIPEDPGAEAASGFKARLAQGMYLTLMNSGVDASLARELVGTAWESLTAGQRRSRPALLRAVTQSALARMAPVSMQDEMPAKKILAFIGPTGVGKTTSLAKLAARLALKHKKKLMLVTLDGYRIGAVEQLRSFAGLMGIPFRFVGQVPELARVIEDNRQRDYILIDTAGRSPRDMEEMRELSSYLLQADHIERHLVLSANAKQSDMRKMVEQFESCRPDHLLFTKLDETATTGSILNELVRTRKSFAYYTNGQKVPDDLHTVTREGLLDIVLNPYENAMRD